MVDHISRDNSRWRSLLETLQTWQTPITREWLLTQSECGVNGWELSVKLEAFLVDHMLNWQAIAPNPPTILNYVIICMIISEWGGWGRVI